MIPSARAKWTIPDEVGALKRQLRVRMLNCSAAGCLLETNGPIAIGTVGRLRVSFNGKEFDDPIQVVRCELMKDAADVHHVAAKFLSMTPPYAGTLRYMMWREVGVLPGFLDTPDPQ
jgi:hypothetical protein